MKMLAELFPPPTPAPPPSTVIITMSREDAQKLMWVVGPMNLFDVATFLQRSKNCTDKGLAFRTICDLHQVLNSILR